MVLDPLAPKSTEPVAEDGGRRPAFVDDGSWAGFALLIEGETAPLWCEDARGFSDALDAAIDGDKPAPARLVLVGADDPTVRWLDEWAEDVEHVRRTITLHRRDDAEEVTLVATLASHGYGIDTSLALESVQSSTSGELLRSGVHLRGAVEAALAPLDEDGDL